MSYILPLAAKEVEQRLIKVADLAVHPAVYVEADALIKVDLSHTTHVIEDGTEIKFKAPIDCTAVTKLLVLYTDTNGKNLSKKFAFADANGNDIGDLGKLFAKDTIVKVILDFNTNIGDADTGAAFVQNADTNKYLEENFHKINEYLEGQLFEDVEEYLADTFLNENEAVLKAGEGNNSIIQIAASETEQSKATGIYSIALGNSNKVCCDYSFAANLSNEIAEDAVASFACGVNNSISAPTGFVTGQGNELDVPNGARLGRFSKATDALFAIGNGKAANSRSNAFEVFEDGSIAVNSLKFTADELKETITSCENMKEQLKTLDDSIQTVTQDVAHVDTQVAHIDERAEQIDAQVAYVNSLVDLKYRTHTDGIGPLVEIAETYFNVAYDPKDRLEYESKTGLFADNVTYTDEDNNDIKAIVCSQFVQACISGIDYKNSRYVTKDTDNRNHRRAWGFVSDGSGDYSFKDWNPYNDYMDAGNQAKYFEGLGELKTFDVNRNALKPGDLLFYTSDTATEKYKNISHVAICLAAGDTRHIIMHASDGFTRLIDDIEPGVAVQDFTYNRYSPDYYVRSPIIAEYTSKLIKAQTINKSGICSAGKTSYIYHFTFDNFLERGFYTVHFDDSGDSSLGYIKVVYENDDETTGQNISCIKKAGCWSTVFYAERPISAIHFRVAQTGVSEVSSYSVNKVALYRGYRMEMPNELPNVRTEISNAPVAQLITWEKND